MKYTDFFAQKRWMLQNFTKLQKFSKTFGTSTQTELVDSSVPIKFWMKTLSPQNSSLVQNIDEY